MSRGAEIFEAIMAGPPCCDADPGPELRMLARRRRILTLAKSERPDWTPPDSLSTDEIITETYPQLSGKSAAYVKGFIDTAQRIR